MKTLNNDINSWHARLKHCVASDLFPGQSEPPFTGGGLLHDLYLVNTLIPHVAEHVPHTPHAPQFPFTMPNEIYVLYISIDMQQYHNNVYF